MCTSLAVFLLSSFLPFYLSSFLPCCRASAPEVSLAEVLARAGAYVVEFQQKLAGIVAEERYIQEVKAPSSFVRSSRPTYRDLKSDLLLVRPTDADLWIQFRDVFEVDATPVRDRSERLMKLFLEPTASTATQVQRIVEESSRYNIGNLQRTVNVPVLALGILDPVNQPRFKFTRTRDEKPTLVAKTRDTAANFRSTAEVWIVEYLEVERRTIIRTTNGRDLPSRGRFWIEPDTGRVLMTELVAQDAAIRGVIDVSYRSEPIAGLLVPTEMRERYDIRRDGSRVEGTATYGKFRQFQVKVDEKIAPIKDR